MLDFTQGVWTALMLASYQSKENGCRTLSVESFLLVLLRNTEVTEAFVAWGVNIEEFRGRLEERVATEDGYGSGTAQFLPDISPQFEEMLIRATVHKEASLRLYFELLQEPLPQELQCIDEIDFLRAMWADVAKKLDCTTSIAGCLISSGATSRNIFNFFEERKSTALTSLS